MAHLRKGAAMAPPAHRTVQGEPVLDWRSRAVSAVSLVLKASGTP
jgi:hypothetical protein